MKPPPAHWSILYRGPLSSCNYACGYCPFAKTRNTPAELRDDAERLARFAAWAGGRAEKLGILFTPWGEALGHRYYQQALAALSHTGNVRRVAIQTNLAHRLDWVADANPATLALWCTFHPTEVNRERFVRQCHRLDARGIRYSVGVVGVREALAELAPLRDRLRPAVYVWVNAYKRTPDYYTAGELARLTAFDPWFPLNNRRHASRGRACRTGHTVFSVDGAGDARRCHFVRDIIGNIYAPDFAARLQPRPCPAETCGCHIGYAHLEHLELEKVFGAGLLERIPSPA